MDKYYIDEYGNLHKTENENNANSTSHTYEYLDYEVSGFRKFMYWANSIVLSIIPGAVIDALFGETMFELYENPRNYMAKVSNLTCHIGPYALILIPLILVIVFGVKGAKKRNYNFTAFALSIGISILGIGAAFLFLIVFMIFMPLIVIMLAVLLLLAICGAI